MARRKRSQQPDPNQVDLFDLIEQIEDENEKGRDDVQQPDDRGSAPDAGAIDQSGSDPAEEPGTDGTVRREARDPRRGADAGVLGEDRPQDSNRWGGAIDAVDQGPQPGDQRSDPGADQRASDGSSGATDGAGNRGDGAGALAVGPRSGEPVTWSPPQQIVSPSGSRVRASANIAAIEMLRRLQRENRWATADEQAILAQYSSWGAAQEIFDTSRQDWTSYREQLRSVVDEATFDELARSTLTAFYTAPDVVEAMWTALEDAGLDGGTVLEPGSGIGAFIGAAPQGTSMVGVEVDPIAAGIAEQLYPSATVINQPMQSVPLQSSAFDAAIGNVPFGDVTLYDPVGNPAGHSIHNHFIMKSLNAVAPGGYVAVVTSSSTADAPIKGRAARSEMVDRADLVSGVRLPSQTFRRVAGTDVTADLLLFRVREPGVEPTERSKQFLITDTLEMDEGQELKVNAFFVRNPEHVLGEAKITTGRFGTPTLRVDGTAEGLGQRIVQRLRPDITEAVAAGLGHSAVPVVSAAQSVQELVSQEAAPLPGAVFFDGKNRADYYFSQFTDGQWESITPKRKALSKQWVQLLELRDTTVQLRQELASDSDPLAIAELRERLNEQYDGYVGEFGAINRFQIRERQPSKAKLERTYNQLVDQWRSENTVPASEQPPEQIREQLRADAAVQAISRTKVRDHIGVLDRDPYFAQVRALEIFDDETQQATKAAIFTSNPARATPALLHTDDLAEAVTATQDRYGRLDLDVIAELTDESPSWVAQQLPKQNLAFRDPQEPNSFVPATEYLSGFVVAKLNDAIMAQVSDERFAANVQALEKVQPDRIEEGITVRPGVQWLDSDLYRQFAAEKFGLNPERVVVDRAEDVWSVSYSGEYQYGGEADHSYGLIAAKNRRGVRFNFQATGKAAGMENQGVATNRADGVAVSALRMYESVLNLSAPTVKYSSAAEEYGYSGTHAQGSSFAARKAEHLRDEFSTWVLSDPARRASVVDRYNEIYNSFVAPVYDGTARKMPGLGEDFVPYTYQLNAVERMTRESGVLLDHVVGAGKTGTMLMGAAELKRLGVIHQPWMVVPNHLAEQITREAQQWYPNAKVLSASTGMSPQQRRQFVAQTTAQDWDLVVVPQSVFEAVDVNTETKIDYMSAQLDQINTDLAERSAAGEDDSAWTTKRLQAAKIKREQQLEKLLDSDRDEGLTFNDTGCDYLIVDEAHLYKNLFRQSRVDELNHPGSNRATDLDMKLDLLREKHRSEGRNPQTTPTVTFATGTPIANNLAEIWVMNKYLRPDLTEKFQMETINGFAAQFTEQVETVEVNASGSGLRTMNRVGGYLNTGDLAAATSLFMDVVGADQITAKLPERASGAGNRIVEFEVETQVKDFISDLALRDEYDWDQDPEERIQVPLDKSGATIDNSLKISSDGRKATLHPALAGMEIDGAGARVEAVAGNILDQWHRSRNQVYRTKQGDISPNPGGLQIVFCDAGTPKQDGSFSVYDAIRRECAERGMDASRIAFVHEWDKDRTELFRRCREGGIDVLIGSTEKLGTGANIQDRAVALHHVDVPWRPADLEQREGRIIRQGNQNESVEIYNYVAAGTFDAVQWQVLHRKQMFISQFKKADRSMRRMDSLGDDSVNAAAHNKAIATGDPRYVDLMQLDKKVEHFEQLQGEWQAARASISFAISSEQMNIDSASARMATMEPLLDRAQQWAADGGALWEFPDWSPTTDVTVAADRITSTLHQMFRDRQSEPQEVMSVAGVTIKASLGIDRTSQNHDLGIELRVDGETERSGFIDGMKIMNAREAQRNLKTEGTASQEARAILTRVDRPIRELPGMYQLAQAQLDSAERRLAKLQATATPTFEHSQELADARQAQGKLRRELEEVDSSAQMVELRNRRRERLAAHGREPGWTLDLNPTPAYAKHVKDTGQDEVVHQARRKEVSAMFKYGLIDEDTYSARMSRIPRPEQDVLSQIVAASIAEAFGPDEQDQQSDSGDDLGLNDLFVTAATDDYDTDGLEL